MRTRAAGLGWSMVLLLPVATIAADRDLRLVEAVERQDRAAVTALVKEGADVNAAQPDGGTPLHWAAHWDDLQTADLLLQAGARADAANDHGVTPLSLACLNGSAAMVERILKAGANPNIALGTGETALMTAAHTGSADVVKLLLAHGANPNAGEPRQGQTALMWAVSEKHPDVAQALIEHGAEVNARSKRGFTPLLFAVREGTVESARILLAAGVNVNEAAPDGTWPLTLAIASGHEGLAMFLLEKGADANASLEGYAALHAAVASRKLTLLKALLAHNANPNARLARMAPPGGFRGGGDGTAAVNVRGATPFWLAAANLSPEFMRVLLDAGADPSLTPEDKTTPLMVAAGFGQNDSSSNWDESRALEAVKFLVGRGADVVAAGQAGATALHGSAYVGANSIVQFLVDNGARLNAQDKQGQTPFRVAQGHRGIGATFIERKSTAELLRKLGADTTLGVDPQILFRERGNAQIPR